ncbi:AMP-binding protein [Planococcus faecalis]|uniref:AMP-binding protein n=1 Tax=Planococcus faecalis TaxID=1598147 RepID=UPI000B1A8BD8
MKREELLAPDSYNLVEEIERYATGDGKLAILWENDQGEKHQLTYDELIEHANRAANSFETAGLVKGDVVLVMVPRLIEAYVAYIGALKAGLAVIPSSEMLRAKDIAYRLNHSDAKAVIAYEPFMDQFEGVKEMDNVVKFVIGKSGSSWISLVDEMAAASPEYIAAPTKKDDMAFLSYTSGTTGNPKGAVHSHGWAYAHLRTSAEHWLGAKEGMLFGQPQVQVGKNGFGVRS